MSDIQHIPRFVWRLLKFGQIPYARGLGSNMGRLVLLLTTKGRKTGLPRVTPLQYEEQDGVFYVGSARGKQADWFRNIIKDPHVEVQIADKHLPGLAEPITEPVRIAEFLELRLRRHPHMIGAFMRFHGLPVRPDCTQLEELGKRLALVAIRPCGPDEQEVAS